MARRSWSVLTLAGGLLLTQTVAFAAEVPGKPDQASGPNWQSAYMDLQPAQSFKKGDRIVIRVEGSAEWVKVRLLPEGADPGQPTGMVGSRLKVPANRKLIITLREDRPRVSQISVHAGKEAWGEVINPKGGEVQIVGVDLNP